MTRGSPKKAILTPRRRRLLRHTYVAVAIIGGISATVVVTEQLRRAAPADTGIEDILGREVPDDAPDVRFIDASANAGIDFRHFSGTRTHVLPEDMGSGVAWGDCDNDDLPDLYLVNFVGPLPSTPAERANLPGNALYRNRGDGTFEEISEAAGVGLQAFGLGATWGDYDDDGDFDLYITNYGPNVLFENRGSCSFVDVTERADVDGGPTFSAGATWGDHDGDGDLDLYVTNYVDFSPSDQQVTTSTQQYGYAVPFTLNPAAYDPTPNVLFRNAPGRATVLQDRTAGQTFPLVFPVPGVCPAPMHAKRYLSLILGPALSMIIVLGCSGGTDPGSSSDPAVLLANIEFSPNRVQAAVGDTIRFVNQDQFDHDVYLVRTANRNDVLVSPTTIPPGNSVTVTIEQEGLYTLYCTIHGGMTGKITTTGSFELTEEEKKRAASRKVLPPIAKTGETLFWDRAQCHQCHRIGNKGDGDRGPDLLDIGFRADARAEKLGLNSGTAYIVQSIMQPDAHVVEGYTNDMATVYQPPIDLEENELQAVIAYLQSQGGEVDTWLIDIDQKLIASEPPANPYRQGNPAAGRELFQKMGCHSCHQLRDHKPISVGPELTEIGAYRNWEWLAESTFDPNAEIGSNWKRATVHLKSGRSVTGTLRKNTEAEVKLLVLPDQLETFAGNDVDRVEIHDKTRMPENYGELMTPEEKTDLIKYLQSLKGGPASASR